MIPFLRELSANFRFADSLDIGVTAVFLYFAIRWLRQRASRSMAMAIATIGVLYTLSRWLDMHVTSLLFHAGLVVVFVALVLIFHIDIRRAFERLAAWEPFKRDIKPQENEQTINTLAESVFTLAAGHVGALIVLSGRESMEQYIRGGIPINGQISYPLISSIFDTSSAGHDGAIIVHKNKIEKLGVHLPSSGNITELKGAGTRHAAALGLSERSDAMILVVSEERGTVSIAHKGKLKGIKTIGELTSSLIAFYQEISPSAQRQGHLKWIIKDIRLKMVALMSAFLIWLLLGYRVETVYRTFMVPVEFRNIDETWIIEDPRPTTIRVSLSGPKREFDFDPSSLVFAIDFSDVKEGTQSIFVTRDNLVRPNGLNVRQIQPNVVKLQAYRMISREFPVKISYKGKLPPGKKLTAKNPEFTRITLLVRKKSANALSEIKTEPIDLSTLQENTTVQTKLIIPEFARLPEGSASSVAVKLIVDTSTDEQN